MHLTQLNRECLLHLFSFLDKDSRKSLASTCPRLRAVFEEPALWPLLHFRSLAELRKDNFLLGPALRSLSICWHSSRAQVCGTEDWRRSAFHRAICSGHERLVNDFLLQVCDRTKPALPGQRVPSGYQEARGSALCPVSEGSQGRSGWRDTESSEPRSRQHWLPPGPARLRSARGPQPASHSHAHHGAP
ncbi:F-box and leucine-rich protein 22 isoform X2 [Lepus europaeus]|uniref:F-box and leucine-rich protein 22 isoform X2 n=1 Tax=Lepus europaeus TaxID=9983 RepID=UPI002B4A074B|nr:F-box and leucine-rich protein 22 isoform X2 [Lepus europaeus]